MFFASSQNNKLLFGESPTSPRASRKFSSPPPLAIAKNSSPNRRRKLSLNIPIITGGKALDLAALSCSSNGYASMYSSMSPFSKTTLDINKLYVSSPIASKIQDEGEGDKKDRTEDSAVSKQGGLTRSCLPADKFLRQAALLSLIGRVISSRRRSLGAGGERQRPEPERRGRTGGFAHQVADHPEKRQMQKLFRCDTLVAQHTDLRFLCTTQQYKFKLACNASVIHVKVKGCFKRRSCEPTSPS